MSVAASILYIGIFFTFIESTFLWLIIPVLELLSGILAGIITRSGRIKAAIFVFMLVNWFVLTIVSVVLFGGLTSPTIALYVLVILTVSLTLGGTPAYFFGVLTSASIFSMYLGEVYGFMPDPLIGVTPFRTLLVHLINLIIAVALVRHAIQEIDKSKAQSKKRGVELDEFVASIEATIAQRTNNIAEQKIFFETLFNNIPVGFVFVDPDNKIVATNNYFEALFGYSHFEVLGKVLDPLVTTEETLSEAEYYTSQSQMGLHPIAKCKRKRKDGSLVDVEMQGVPIIIDGEHMGALAIYRDITDSLSAEKELVENEARFRSLFENSPISLWEEDFSGVKVYLDAVRKSGITDFQKYFEEHADSVIECAQKIKILNVNQATISIFKAKNKEEMLTNISEVLGEDSLDVFREELVALGEGALEFSCEIHQKRLDGKLIIGDLRLSIAPGYADLWEKVFVSIQDITEAKYLESQLKESLSKMEILATTDPLTGLLNRRAIIDFARAELARAGRGDKPLGLALIDMDYLKDINDQHGHLVGDTALRLIGKTLKETLRSYDYVGRWGGDEFLVVIPQASCDVVSKLAERLKAAINDTELDLPDGDKMWLQACIGTTCAPEGDDEVSNIEELLVVADKALYQAKGLGRNKIVFLEIQ